MNPMFSKPWEVWMARLVLVLALIYLVFRLVVGVASLFHNEGTACITEGGGRTICITGNGSASGGDVSGYRGPFPTTTIKP